MNKIEDNLYFIQFARPDIYSKLVLRYNFLETGFTIKNNGINSGQLSANIIPFPYELWSTSGRGYFSGNYARITGINNFINYNNSTFIIDFEKVRVGSSTLVSSITKNNILQYNQDGSTYFINVNQGFEFGVTANNNLYFEYFEASGAKVFIQDSNLSNKSSAYLSISNNEINFGYFDFVQNSLINSNFSINSNFIYNPQNLYIGYNPESINSYNNNQPFLGFIYNFIVGSGLFNRELPFIHTGFIHDTYASGGSLTSGLVTGVTGRRYEITGSGLYITGFQRTATGVIYDDWGFQTVGYTNSPLYGLRPLYGFTLLTGSFFQFSNDPLVLSLEKNLNKCNNYNKDFIKFTTDKINDDLIEIGLITGDISKINNKNLFLSQNRFDYGYYLPNRVIENESLFINGQYQTSGELIDLSNSYNPDLIRIVKNDYGIENGKIVPFNLYGQQSSDSIFIDFNTGETICFEDLYIEPSISIPLLVNNNFNIFFNGQKLTENIDYIFQPNPPFNFAQKLSGDSAGDQFGYSVATNGDGTVIVMGGRFDNFAGGAIVFTGNSTVGWTQKQKLSGDSANDQFGLSVATNGDGTVIVMGGPGNDGGITLGSGAALVFTGNSTVGWTQKQKLSGDSAADQFGYSVATNGDGTVIVMGGIGNDGGTTVGSGAALVFTGNSTVGWTQKQKLSGDSANDQFGFSVDTNSNGTVIVMGGRFHDPNGILDAGAALVFTGNSTVGWTQKQKLSGDSADDQFGYSVATNGDGTVIVMGGIGNDGGIPVGSGAALVFTGNSTVGWTQKQKLSGDSINDRFGFSVATNGDGTVVVMGGIGNDGGTFVGSGAAMIFTLKPEIIFNQNSYKYTGVTGNLCFISKNYDYSYIESGKPYSYSPQKYYEGLSEIYVNGIRQSYNEDYNELSSLNLKTGVLFLEQLPDIIYNN